MANPRLSARRIRLNGMDSNLSVKPGEASDIHREPQLPDKQEVILADALRREHIDLRKGFEKMGFSGDTLELAMSLQEFHRKHFRNVIDLLGGGMVKQYLEICNEVKKITEIISAADYNLPPEFYDVLRKDRQGLLDTIIKMYDRAVQAALVGAKVEYMRKHGADVIGGRKNKPGFGPLKSANPPEPIET
jgi:hypothetical protein